MIDSIFLLSLLLPFSMSHFYLLINIKILTQKFKITYLNFINCIESASLLKYLLKIKSK